MQFFREKSGEMPKQCLSHCWTYQACDFLFPWLYKWSLEKPGNKKHLTVVDAMNMKHSFFCSNFGSVCVLSPANLKRGWVTNFDVIVFTSLHTNVNLNNKETANNPPCLVGWLLLLLLLLFCWRVCFYTLPFCSKWRLIQRTISVQGLLWYNRLSIVINKHIHDQYTQIADLCDLRINKKKW